MWEQHCVLGVHVTDRLTEAPEVQKLLTACGRHTRTRLGLHEIEKGTDAPNGLILLETVGGGSEAAELADKRSALDGVEIQSMVFEQPTD